MSEQIITTAAVKLHQRKQEIAEREKHKEELTEPEKPDEPVPYNKASQYGHRKSEYDKKIKNLDRQISDIKNEMRPLKKDIKDHIPAVNVPIKITGEDEKLVVTHIKNEEENRIDLKQLE